MRGASRKGDVYARCNPSGIKHMARCSWGRRSAFALRRFSRPQRRARGWSAETVMPLCRARVTCRGRQTTVPREMVQIPGADCVVDMPGQESAMAGFRAQ